MDIDKENKYVVRVNKKLIHPMIIWYYGADPSPPPKKMEYEFFAGVRCKEGFNICTNYIMTSYKKRNKVYRHEEFIFVGKKSIVEYIRSLARWSASGKVENRALDWRIEAPRGLYV